MTNLCTLRVTLTSALALPGRSALNEFDEKENYLRLFNL